MEQEPHKLPIRYYEIDLLRFVAAMTVVFYHYTFRMYAADNFSPVGYDELGWATRYGWLGVQLFFLISGYVVLMSAYKKSVRQFFVSRVVRLYPAFWVACTITALACVLFGPSLAQIAEVPTWKALHVTLKQYLYNLTMLHSFGNIADVDGVYWTLRTELLFYFLVSLLIGYRLMARLPLVLLCWLVFTAVAGPAPGPEYSLFTLLFPRYAPFFIGGMLFYMVQENIGDRWKNYVLLVLALALSVRGVKAEVAFLTVHYKADLFSLPVVFAVVIAFYGLFWLIVHGKLRIHAKWAQQLGALTYPLYLTHGILGVLVFLAYGPTTNRWVLLLGLLVVMLTLAWVIHRLVEKPGSKWLDKAMSRLLDYLGGKPRPEAATTVGNTAGV